MAYDLLHFVHIRPSSVYHGRAPVVSLTEHCSEGLEKLSAL